MPGGPTPYPVLALQAYRPNAAKDWDAMLAAVLCRLRNLAAAQAAGPLPGQAGLSLPEALHQCAGALGHLQRALDPAWGHGQWLEQDVLSTRVGLVQALALHGQGTRASHMALLQLLTELIDPWRPSDRPLAEVPAWRWAGRRLAPPRPTLAASITHSALPMMTELGLAKRLLGLRQPG